MSAAPAKGRLPRRFFAGDTLQVARDLLGCVLRHDGPGGTAAGIIVETEGYLEHGDAASHARFGATGRSGVMFGPPGIAYVYLIYGMHFMCNVVTEPEGRAGAVLIRALEPVEGLELMAARRERAGGSGSLASGPGRLSQALALTLQHNGCDLTRGPLGIWRGKKIADCDLAVTPRIGVCGSQVEPYRFMIKGNSHVSG